MSLTTPRRMDAFGTPATKSVKDRIISHGFISEVRIHIYINVCLSIHLSIFIHNFVGDIYVETVHCSLKLITVSLHHHVEIVELKKALCYGFSTPAVSTTPTHP